MPVLQAFTGCDTTSRLFVIEKSQRMKRIPDIHENIKIFCQKEQIQDTVVCGGERILLPLFITLALEKKILTLWEWIGGMKSYKFKIKADKIQSLHLTGASAKYQSLGVYLQYTGR